MSILSLLDIMLGGGRTPVETESAETDESVPAAQAPVHIFADALMRVDNGVLRIERRDAPPVERPIEFVASLHVHGHASLTSPAVAALVGAGAPVLWRGHHGFAVAIAQPLAPAGVSARMAQYDAARDQARRMAIARPIVHAKIVAMRGALRRRRADADALARLAHFARKSLHAGAREALMGIEGAASAVYFRCWPDLMRHRGAAFDFSGRSRRPPLDAPNALISYFYAFLEGECVCAAAAAGLDPRVGFLHDERAGRHALALDLLELFRAPVADTAALMALNSGELRTEHFGEGDAARMTEEGRRIAVSALERRLGARAVQGEEGGRGDWRSAIEVEARSLAQALARGRPYAPVLRP